MHITQPLSSDALLLIDIQNDFIEGGALAVAGALNIIPHINKLTSHNFKLIVASRDWHPKDHCSFHDENGSWPHHCIAGTKGAEFSPLLDLSSISHIFHKGRAKKSDSYSAFFNQDNEPTGLASLLQEHAIRRVFIAGIALDYCVKATAIDAKKYGFKAIILADYCASIGEKQAIIQTLEQEEHLYIHRGIF